MLTTDEIINLDSSVVCNSNFQDKATAIDNDAPSEEDFLEQLSADLDIPMLLDQGTDGFQHNPFVNISPDDLLAEAMSSVPLWKDDIFDELQISPLDWGPEGFPNLSADVKMEYDSNSNSSGFYSDSTKSHSPTPSQSSEASRSSAEVKNEDLHLDTPPVSPETRVLSPRINRQVPIQPKPVIEDKNIIVIPSEDVIIKEEPDVTVIADNGIRITPAVNTNKVVVIENVPMHCRTVKTVAPISNINFSTVPVLYPNETDSLALPVSSHIDMKALKRQQRMIKNRESACLSRKKKKDYVMSLEKQVAELTEENKKLKLENVQLKDKLKKALSGTVFALPKNGKAAAFLLAVFFVVSINIGGLGALIKLNNRPAQLQPLSVSTPELHRGRSLLWSSQTDQSSEINDSPIPANSSALPICPMYVNQTESARLALELHRWIGKPYNTTLTGKRKPKRVKPSRVKGKTYSLSTVLSAPLYNSRRLKKYQTVDENSLEVFSPRPESLYSDFFEAINRRDDTFYVVSFSADHILLPALHHNKTRRPKMSLLLPAVSPNDSFLQEEKVSMMQIDCEVIDTRLLNVNSGTIPRHLRNYTQTEKPEDRKQTDESQNLTSQPAYEPYFVRRKPVKPSKNVEDYYLDNEKIRNA